MNSCNFVGNLTRDPEYRTTQTGKPVVNFSIALSNRVKQSDGSYKDNPIYIDFEAWDQQADFINQYFKKGSCIVVESSVKTDSWEDNEGKKRVKTRFRVNRASFPPSSPKQSSTTKTGTAKKVNTESSNEAFASDEEIPF